MPFESLLSLPLIEKAAVMLGRPKLILSYDDTSSNNREIVPEVARTAPHGNIPPFLIRTGEAAYLRVDVENIGRSKQAEGCQVFVTSISQSGGAIVRVGSPLSWAHSDDDADFEPRTLFVAVPQTVNLCKVSNARNALVFMSQFAARGGHTFDATGDYVVTLRAVGTNFVSPGEMTLAIHFHVDDFSKLRGEIVDVRGAYRTA
ncbi:MAG TPA: hypothetical protein VGQ81_14720 [Acidobacteriota bacterium]|jgi:hypothetical protein|nr:hypothetical protein [Acidobacteriota bacterium]